MNILDVIGAIILSPFIFFPWETAIILSAIFFTWLMIHLSKSSSRPNQDGKLAETIIGASVAVPILIIVVSIFNASILVSFLGAVYIFIVYAFFSHK